MLKWMRLGRNLRRGRCRGNRWRGCLIAVCGGGGRRRGGGRSGRVVSGLLASLV